MSSLQDGCTALKINGIVFQFLVEVYCPILSFSFPKSHGPEIVIPSILSGNSQAGFVQLIGASAFCKLIDLPIDTLGI
jgi:hypothetical protein